MSSFDEKLKSEKKKLYHKKYFAEWYKKNKERLNLKMKEKYADNRDEIIKKNTEHYYENKEEIAKVNAKYRKKNHLLIREKQKEISKRPEVRKRAISTAYKMIEKYPEKYKARYKFRNAVRLGKIDKLPCEACSELKVEAHHYLGYEGEHWKDVKWLCKKHHMIEHGRWLGET